MEFLFPNGSEVYLKFGYYAALGSPSRARIKESFPETTSKESNSISKPNTLLISEKENRLEKMNNFRTEYVHTQQS